MTLSELKDKLNEFYFSSGIYPDDCKFRLDFYKDLAFIAIFSGNDNGEKVIHEDITFVKTSNGSYRISSICLYPFIDTVLFARFYVDLINQFISQEDFFYE